MSELLKYVIIGALFVLIIAIIGKFFKKKN
jgi:hypothetical protein